MRWTRRERRPAVPVGPGERVLAWCRDRNGVVLAGSRDALYLGEHRIPWEEVEAADWQVDDSMLRVSEVGTWGEQRPVHAHIIDESDRILELVRERVTASVVHQRKVLIEGTRGLRVIARRAPRGDRPVQWVFEYDEGIDPDDPAVRDAARGALAVARDELGDF